jgi:hypothetical protein
MPESNPAGALNWREQFPFTHVFRSFRLAIHPSKLALGLLALVALYMGGRLLDGLWNNNYRARPGEIEIYRLAPDSRAFRQILEERQQNAYRAYANLILETNLQKPEAEKFFTTDPLGNSQDHARQRMHLSDVRYYIRHTFLERRMAEARQARDISRKRVEEEPADTAEKQRKREADLREVEADYQKAVADAFADARAKLRIVEAVEGDGPFKAFFHYQAATLNAVTRAVLANNWVGGINDDRAEPGVIVHLYRFVTVGPSWALRHHTLYFLLYGAWFLCVWSLCGGAIARIAAVHAADEGRKPSLRQGLEFSIHKFLSFLSAPLIPVLIVLGIGLAMAVVAFILTAIPYVGIVGRIVVGLLLILALLGGLVITLVILGTAGGLNLMYPTIAVEGSDSFDAISRSFSYVYARPWKMLFYTLVAVAYGSLCYLFIRLAIWLVLLTTHFFVGLLMFQEARNLQPLWTAIWPTPSLTSFTSAGDGLALDGAATVASFFVHCWVYLVVSLLGAFAISFYFSSNTIIYYLLRKDVDATDMDDVYLEETEDDFAEQPAPAAPANQAASTAAAPPPAAEASATAAAAPEQTPEAGPEARPTRLPGDQSPKPDQP